MYQTDLTDAPATLSVKTLGGYRDRPPRTFPSTVTAQKNGRPSIGLQHRVKDRGSMPEGLVMPEFEIFPPEIPYHGMAGIAGDKVTGPHSGGTDNHTGSPDFMVAGRQFQENNGGSVTDSAINFMTSLKILADFGY
jgi:hypothetical protein